MLTLLLRALSVTLFLASGGLASLWNARRGLPYNEEGRYFDPEHGLVLNDGAVLTFGVAAIAALVLACRFWAVARRRARSADKRG